VKKFVDTDNYYTNLASKLDIIKWILNSDPKSMTHGSYTIYNVKWIENDYNDVYTQYGVLKNTNKSYLSEYSDSGVGTLRQQFADLWSWMLTNDSKNKETVI